MKTLQSGVSAMLKDKLAKGEGVSHHDLLAICEVITHNAQQLSALESRVTALETPPATPKASAPLTPAVICFMGLPTKILH